MQLSFSVSKGKILAKMLAKSQKNVYLCSMIDYKEIPDWWAVCPMSDCKLAETCLRQQVCRQLPEKIKKWYCILPHMPKGDACEYFQKYEKVTMAEGIAAVYKNVKDRPLRTQIRLDLTRYFGSKGTYYRYKNGQRLINPKMQQDIRDIVHRYVPEAEVGFDKTFEAYDFTQW